MKKIIYKIIEEVFWIIRNKEGRTNNTDETVPQFRKVAYEYVGTDRQFNEFLKAVIREYISADLSETKMNEDKIENKNKSETKTA